MLAKTPIEHELLTVCKQHPRVVDESWQVYMKRLVQESRRLSDAQFNELSPGLQDWLNAAASAMTAKTPIAKFIVDEEDEEELKDTEDDVLGLDDTDSTIIEELIDLGWKNTPFHPGDRGASKRNEHYILGFRLMRDKRWTSPRIAKTLKVPINTVNNWRRTWLKSGWIKSDAYKDKHTNSYRHINQQRPQQDPEHYFKERDAEHEQLHTEQPTRNQQPRYDENNAREWFKQNPEEALKTALAIPAAILAKALATIL